MKPVPASRPVARALIGLIAMSAASFAFAAGDAERGARVFRACAACHSLEPGRHMTGPSLAGMWGRKAAALDDFPRYSAALKRSGILWNEKTLDAWLADPEKMVPGNFMLFQGIDDQQPRADLIAFLREASEKAMASAPRTGALPNLKKAPTHSTVTSIRHCGDTYFVTNGKGDMLPFWEFNLRFKTDSSESGPAASKPVLVGQGMRGDRAQVVFASPSEISAFIKQRC